VVVFVIWTIDYSRANLQTINNAGNLFNDDRWCLVNYAIAPNFCANTAVPPMGTAQYLISQPSLGLNGITLINYWMMFAFFILVFLQALYIRLRWTPIVNAYFVSAQDPMEEAEPEEGEQQEKKDYAIDFASLPPTTPKKPFVTPSSVPAANPLQMPLRGGGGKRNHRIIK